MKLVESINHLKELASNEQGDFIEFYILLSKFARSSKRILYYYDIDEFYIINEIDDSYQELKTHQLASETILVSAIERKSLFLF